MYKFEMVSVINMNLVIVQVECECLHDACEDHETGADQDADVDVLKGLFLLRQGSRQYLEEQMS